MYEKRQQKLRDEWVKKKEIELKHERDRERLRKLHEKLRQEKIQQMIGLDKIADISTAQLDGAPEVKIN